MCVQAELRCQESDAQASSAAQNLEEATQKLQEEQEGRQALTQQQASVMTSDTDAISVCVVCRLSCAARRAMLMHAALH